LLTPPAAIKALIFRAPPRSKILFKTILNHFEARPQATSRFGCGLKFRPSGRNVDLIAPLTPGTEEGEQQCVSSRLLWRSVWRSPDRQWQQVNRQR
jgi:hypothetical protein